MYEYHATVLRVVDGDTIDCLVDLGFDVKLSIRLRMAGIDAPERGTPGGTEATLWMCNKLSPRSEIIVRTEKDRREKFGRFLAYVFLVGDVYSLNQQMIDGGIAVIYSGGKR